MIHPSEDDLLRHALDAHETEDDHARIERHVDDCPECRARIDAVNADIGVIASVRPQRRVLQLPVTRRPRVNVYAILRAAALVILGISLGYGWSNRNRPEAVEVTSAYVTLAPPADSLRRYAVSDATEVPSHYYQSLMNQDK